EQKKLQQDIVQAWKSAGANTVVLRFEEFPQESLERFMPSQDEEENLLNSKNPPAFLAIASGKGVVGKSTVPVKLAVALARQGKQVGL
ncbi:P-loop NTPase, partial [Bacillus pumilus]